MTYFLKAFAKKENGAVTTEFLVACAAVVGLGVAVFASGGENNGATKVVNVDPDAGLTTFVAGF